MVKPIGGEPHLPPKTQEVANLNSRIMITNSEEISGSVYPRFGRDVDNNTKFLKATDKKGVMTERHSVTPLAVKPSRAVSSTLNKLGNQLSAWSSKKSAPKHR